MMDFIKIKSFYASKNMKKVKRELTDREIFANHKSDKDLWPEYLQNSYNNNNNKKTKIKDSNF